MPRPRLTFFCELGTPELEALFADPAVIASLASLEARVSLGLLDLSDGRAGVVRRLNEAGISVVAWLLLPPEEGYWFNLGNSLQAAARYGAFTAWTDEHALRWAGVGLDIEPDMREIRQLAEDRRTLLRTLARRAFDHERLRRARADYGALVARVSASYPVESYQVPFIVDERRAGSTLLQRLGGLVDLAVGREVLMLYASFLRPDGEGFVWSYGPEAGAIAVGSTGGGVTVGGAIDVPALSWEELEKSLRLAAQWTHDVYVFSLEGCVRAEYLPRVEAMDWDEPVAAPLGSARRVGRLRRALRAGLWTSAHPALIVGSLAGAIWLLSRSRRNRQG